MMLRATFWGHSFHWVGRAAGIREKLLYESPPSPQATKDSFSVLSGNFQEEEIKTSLRTITKLESHMNLENLLLLRASWVLLENNYIQDKIWFDLIWQMWELRNDKEHGAAFRKASSWILARKINSCSNSRNGHFLGLTETWSPWG